MARQKKPVETEEKADKNTFVCPICQKTFYKTDDTCYFIGENPTCSWKCFLNRTSLSSLVEKSKTQIK